MPSEFWTGQSDNEVTFCGLNWDKVQQAFPVQYGSLVHHYGSQTLAEAEGPHCGAIHWSPLVGVELMHAELFYSMVVYDPIPQDLLNEILEHESEFFRTMDQIPAKELMAGCPFVMPKTNAFPGCDIPGMGKLRLDKYNERQLPPMFQKDWASFAQLVAKKNLGALHTIESIARKTS